jgi:transcriptional regulator with XRE-family HTH domain
VTNPTNEELAANWGEWLRDMLDSKNWTQSDLVAASDKLIRPDRVSKWVNGKERPSHRNAVIVANTLGVSTTAALDVAGYSGGPTNLEPVVGDPFGAEARLNSAKLAAFTNEQLLLELLRRETGIDEAVRPNPVVSLSGVSGYLDDHLKGLDTAAGRDETQADED